MSLESESYPSVTDVVGIGGIVEVTSGQEKTDRGKLQRTIGSLLAVGYLKDESICQERYVAASFGVKPR
ncbi:MAG: hypothetical protein AAGH78_12030 [Cyanobacteria bacterium P01_H01_bin.58]